MGSMESAGGSGCTSRTRRASVPGVHEPTAWDVAEWALFLRGEPVDEADGGWDLHGWAARVVKPPRSARRARGRSREHGSPAPPRPPLWWESIVVPLPAVCPVCGRENGLQWRPRESVISCGSGICPHRERANYVEFSRDSECTACARVLLAIRSGRYSESGSLGRVRVRVCATSTVVRVESAYLWEFSPGEGQATVTPIDGTVVKELCEAGLPARRWSQQDRWR
jgi:hypothetical protein